MSKALSSEESRVCELMGISPHAYIEAREAERAEALNREKPMSEEEIYRLCGVTPEDVAKYSK